MRPLNLPGSFEDAHGVAACEWTLKESELPGWAGRFDITGAPRGVEVHGSTFDSLEPLDPHRADGFLEINSADELRGVVTALVPVKVAGHPETSGELTIVVDLTFVPKYVPDEPKQLRLLLNFGGATWVGQGDEFETALEDLVVGMPQGSQVECCWSCGLSDYSPFGNGLMGMSCHRDAREQYLAVKSKGDHVAVPITEEVPEFYRCESYEQRTPGTGYRG